MEHDVLIQSLRDALDALTDLQTPDAFTRKEVCALAMSAGAAVQDAIDALMPRVLKVDELPEFDGAFIIETRANGKLNWVSWYDEYELYEYKVCRMLDLGGGVYDSYKYLYGLEWRCWNQRPTDAQREAEPWDD